MLLQRIRDFVKTPIVKDPTMTEFLEYKKREHYRNLVYGYEQQLSDLFEPDVPEGLYPRPKSHGIHNIAIALADQDMKYYE